QHRGPHGPLGLIRLATVPLLMPDHVAEAVGGEGDSARDPVVVPPAPVTRGREEIYREGELHDVARFWVTKIKPLGNNVIAPPFWPRGTASEPLEMQRELV